MIISDIIKEITDRLKEKIVTVEDLTLILDQINLIESFLFKDIKIPLSEKITKEVSEDLRLIIENLEKSEMAKWSPNEKFYFFEKIKKELKKILLIKLEIAFEPSKNFLSKISKWLKENIQQDFVLKIIKNPQITGGLIIEYQGKYFDLSLSKKIDEIIEKKIL